MRKDCFTNKNYTTISNAHFLRNPVVNVLPKILPANTNPKNLNKNILRDASPLNENINSEDLIKVSNNKTNIISHNSDASKEHTPHCNTCLKIVTTQEEVKEKTNSNELKVEVQNDILTNSFTSKQSKFSKKSPEMVQELPQLRKTTPRLAKTKSAQNMKLMAQVLGPKGLSSNCNTLKSREKNDLDKNLEKISTLSKTVSTIFIYSNTIKLIFSIVFIVVG